MRSVIACLLVCLLSVPLVAQTTSPADAAYQQAKTEIEKKWSEQAWALTEKVIADPGTSKERKLELGELAITALTRASTSDYGKWQGAVYAVVSPLYPVSPTAVEFTANTLAARKDYAGAIAALNKLPVSPRRTLLIAGITAKTDIPAAVALLRPLVEVNDLPAMDAVYAIAPGEREALITRGLALPPDPSSPGLAAHWQARKVDLLLSQNKKADAIAYIESLTPVPVTLAVRYVDWLQGDSAKQIAMAVKAFKSRAPGPMSVSEARMLDAIMPANDAVRCMLLSAQSVADAYKLHLRAQTGKTNNAEVAEFVKQLNTGDGKKVLVVTDTAKALAAAFEADPTILMGAYLSPLLRGNYVVAAKLSWAQAKAAKTDDEYKTWVAALSAVVRCNDQCYNKRALDVIKWVNGDLATNPISDLTD